MQQSLILNMVNTRTSKFKLDGSIPSNSQRSSREVCLVGSERDDALTPILYNINMNLRHTQQLHNIING